MFYLSWKLSVVAFVSVPLIVIISKYYGEYIRELSKQTQDKLAHANTVAEEVSVTSSGNSRCTYSIMQEAAKFIDMLQQLDVARASVCAAAAQYSVYTPHA
eukprot:5169-Heterococcus_DN1.PRE.4